MKKDSSLIVSRIVALGSLWTPQTSFYDQDMAYLFHATALCQTMGFVFKAPFDIQPLNLTLKLDALDKRVCYPADMVVSCVVNDLRGVNSEMIGLGPRNLQSPHHRDPRAWYRFACRTNAKVITIVSAPSDIGKQDCILASDFEGLRFVKGPTQTLGTEQSLEILPSSPRGLRFETLVRKDVARTLGL